MQRLRREGCRWNTRDKALIPPLSMLLNETSKFSRLWLTLNPFTRVAIPLSINPFDDKIKVFNEEFRPIPIASPSVACPSISMSFARNIKQCHFRTDKDQNWFFFQ
eukprot:TRINITY_DN858_c0_g1_i7.p1 TRINITY_DN858_c0_g1~~TRINITY_DN858_c0_g1_i7.p1  ORF type:complete len:106 (+),score=12.14 TRINITY_DN858_c0_g1_i7:262-579(+)